MIAYPFPAMSQFSMGRVTFCLFFLLITHWGEAQNCPVGCICESSQNKLECPTIPKAPLPPLTTEFKSAGSPENLTSESFNHLQPFFLEILDLSDGNIVYVGDDAFIEFGKVEIIDLSQNRIQSLGKDTLRGCFLLREIRLSNNKISELADTFFANLPQLRHISLNHNALVNQPSNYPYFTTIDLSYNQIRNLACPVERLMLVFLDIRGNPIERISENCWSLGIFMPRLVNFKLEGYLEILRLEHYNMVGSEPFTDFTGLKSMKNLYELTIVGFQISSFIWPAGIGPQITHLSFNNVTCSLSAEKQFLNSLWHTSLNTLDLSSSSQLARILLENQNTWNVLHSLKMLVLRSCNLTSLSSIRGHKLVPEDVLSIDVSDNPLHCDCTLANHLKVKNIQLAGKVAHCATPVRYSGRELPSILHLLCSSAETSQDSITTTQIMENEENTTPENIGYSNLSVKILCLLCPSAETPQESTKQMMENEETLTPVNPEEIAKSKHSDILANQTMQSIAFVLAVVTLLLVTISAFTVSFFYIRRKYRHSVEERTVLYSVNHDSPHTNLLS